MEKLTKPDTSYNTSDNLAVVIPGLLFGAHKSLLPGLNAIAESLLIEESNIFIPGPSIVEFGNSSPYEGLELVRCNNDGCFYRKVEDQILNIFITTWSTKENILWVESLLKESEKYKLLKIHINLLEYKSSELIDFFTTIYNTLDIQYSNLDVSSHTFKRGVVWYLYQKAFSWAQKELYKINPLSRWTLLKIKGNCDLHDPDTIKNKFKSNFIDLLNYSASNFPSGIINNLYSTTDIFYSSSITSKSIGDSVFMSSTDSFLNLLGTSTKFTAQRLSNFFKKYIKLSGINVNSIELLDMIMSSPKYIPWEGQIILYYFIKQAKLEYSHGYNLFNELIKDYILTKSPSMSIKNRKIIIDGSYKLDYEKPLNSPDWIIN